MGDTMKTVYLAGRLFNAAEQLHNLMLEKHLTALGYRVILPQREALRFVHDGTFDLPGLVEDCRHVSADPENIYVGNVDGPDADSGTCVEYGIAIQATGRAIIYRTDFRTSEQHELGVNGMLKLQTTRFVYYPSTLTNLDSVESYYQALAAKIHEGVTSLAL